MSASAVEGVLENAGRRPPTASSFVYFIQGVTLPRIKIGCAKDPIDRLATLRQGSPDELKLLGVIRNSEARNMERALHQMFRALRSHGEWFEPGEVLLAFISKHAMDYAALLAKEAAAHRRATSRATLAEFLAEAVAAD